jgi:quinol monooxygenase YgiN
MILVVARHRVRPEYAGEWARLMADFTDASRAEPGVISFEWCRSLDDPDEIVLIEVFRDADAGAAHVDTDHFRAAIGRLPDLLTEAPQILHVPSDATGWATMGEFTPRP